MKTFNEAENDGTIIISSRIFHAPRQGTFVGTDSAGKKVVAKGIVRPQFVNPETGEIEDEAHVIEGAFERRLDGVANGRFYSLKEVGKERCSLAYQTLLFSTKTPAALIRADNRRFESLTALDLLTTDNQLKVKAGVSPSLLMEELAPWKLFTRFQVQGVRATAYASDLVMPGYGAAPGTLNGALQGALVDAGLCEPTLDAQGKPQWTRSHFMLLPGSAKDLARQCKCKVEDLVGRWFMIHRDPALPNSTSLFPSQFIGVLEWETGCDNTYGVILNPLDPYWKRAEGDFDGDSAAVYVPHADFLPRTSVQRRSYLIDGKTFHSPDAGKQMVEDIANSITGLLGPAILAATRLYERQVEGPYRVGAASLAQASVQAKKHAVNAQGVWAEWYTLFDAVKLHEGTTPYLVTFINALKRSPGLKMKLKVWHELVEAVQTGTWDAGSAIEQALCERVRMLDQLLHDTEYFRSVERAELPKAIVDGAKAQVSTATKQAMLGLRNEYLAKLRELETFEEEITNEDDDSAYEGVRSQFRDDLGLLRSRFHYAAFSGNIDNYKTTVEEAQYALVAYAPPRISVKYVPGKVFEALGTKVQRCILSIVGTEWKNGVYDVAAIPPIPSCRREFDLLTEKTAQVQLEVITPKNRRPGQVLQTTRVMLSSVA